MSSSSKCEFPTPLPEPTTESAIQQLFTAFRNQIKRIDADIAKLDVPRLGGFGAFDDEDAQKYQQSCTDYKTQLASLEGQRRAFVVAWDEVQKIYGMNRCLVAVHNLEERIGDIPFAS